MGKPQSQMGLLLGGLGIGALGLVIFSRREAVTQAASELLDEAQEALEESVDWVQKVIGRVSQHEGRHDSLNLNADGAGLSFGIIQCVIDILHQDPLGRFITPGDFVQHQNRVGDFQLNGAGDAIGS